MEKYLNLIEEKSHHTKSSLDKSLLVQIFFVRLLHLGHLPGFKMGEKFDEFFLYCYAICFE